MTKKCLATAKWKKIEKRDQLHSKQGDTATWRKRERTEGGQAEKNNSQLLRRRMPWLQIDQSINSLIIHSLLIASVRGPSMLSH